MALVKKLLGISKCGQQSIELSAGLLLSTGPLVSTLVATPGTMGPGCNNA